MDNNLYKRRLTKNFEQADWYIKDGYGPGIPVYTNTGINNLNRYINLFRYEIKHHDLKVDAFRPTKLIKKKDFDKFYKDINDYSDEIVTFNDSVVTSDALLQTMSHVVNYRSLERSSGVLSVSSIFRDKGSNLVPLFKEKNIYPVVQIDQCIPSSLYQVNMESLVNLYQDFYAKLGIKIFFVRAKEVPKYAKYELYFIAQLNGHFTNLGMIYVLSEQFKQNLGVDEKFELFNSGFSGKTIFESIELSTLKYGRFIEFPSFETSPLAVFNSTAALTIDIQNTLLSLGVHTEVMPNLSRPYKRWIRSGKFAYVLVHDEFTLFTCKSPAGTVYNSLSKVAEAYKRELSGEAQRIRQLNATEVDELIEANCLLQCKDCFKGRAYGYVRLPDAQKCTNCGKVINQAIFLPNSHKRFY